MAVRVGDTVRVVLEAEVDDVACDGFRLGGPYNARNWITTDGNHVKSIEVIKPATPKVGDVIHCRRDLADLPVGSVVTNSDDKTILIGRRCTIGAHPSFDNGLQYRPVGTDEHFGYGPYTVRYIPE